MAAKTTTQAGEIARAEQLAAGTQKHFATATSLKFASADHTPKDITDALDALVTLLQAVIDARNVVKVKLAAVKAQAPALRVLMRAYETFVKATFSESPDVLADFGLQPKKSKTPLTTTEMAVANAKREATRKARGITGKKAKEAVTGGVIDLVTATVKAGPPVVESPAAAPSNAGSNGSTAGNAGSGGAATHGA